MNVRLSFSLVLTTMVGLAFARIGSPERRATGCSNAWEQCGGLASNYNGPTCCIPGYECKVDSEWWHQCRPAPVTPGCRPGWARCGGIGHSGSTCCTEGWFCKEANPWYSQCRPNSEKNSGGPSPADAPSESPSTSTMPSSKPSASPIPSSQPSTMPSESPMPSLQPSSKPSESPMPSSQPSPAPTRSFGEMRTCTVTGDPHFNTFSGVKHSFMGQPTTGKISFYYVAACAGPSDRTVPFRILGQHYNNKNGAGLDYLTLELEDIDGSLYYLWMSSALHAYGDGSQVSYDYDTNINNSANLISLGSNVQTAIGNLFQVTYLQIGFSEAKFTLWIDGNKAVEIYMKGQSLYVAGRYRQHTALIRVDTAYEEEMCGLCGPLDTCKAGSTKTYLSSMPACGGGMIDFPTTPNVLSTDDHQYDLDGWTYEIDYYMLNCGTYYDISDNTNGLSATDRKTCDASIESDVSNACQAAYDAVASSQCIGALSGYCIDLLSYCKVDACVEADGDITAIDDAVQVSFTDVIGFMTQLDFTKLVPATSVCEVVAPPLLRYTFDDYSESITGGDPSYDLVNGPQVDGNSNQAAIVDDNGDKYLSCDGAGDYVYSQNNLLFSGITDHSMSVWVRLTDLTNPAGGAMAVDSNYDATNGDYSHNKQDSIVYNEVANNKRWFLGSEFFQRTDISGGITQEDTPSQWLHMVAVYDVTNGRAKLYRNAVEEQNYVPGGGFFTDLTNARLMFCQRHFAAGGADLKGDVDLGEFYDYALSESDVLKLYHRGRQGSS